MFQPPRCSFDLTYSILVPTVCHYSRTVPSFKYCLQSASNVMIGEAAASGDRLSTLGSIVSLGYYIADS